MPEQKDQPATLRAWAATGAALLAVILGFALLIRADIQRPHAFDPATCTDPVPAGLVWDCTVRPGDDYYAVDGCAFLAGERFTSVDDRVVLYDTVGDRYLCLATAMVRREQELLYGDDGINYSFGGFTAFVRSAALPAAPEDCEVCLCYRSNGHDFLYHSGQTLAGGQL